LSEKFFVAKLQKLSQKAKDFFEKLDRSFFLSYFVRPNTPAALFSCHSLLPFSTKLERAIEPLKLTVKNIFYLKTPHILTKSLEMPVNTGEMNGEVCIKHLTKHLTNNVTIPLAPHPNPFSKGGHATGEDRNGNKE